MKKIVFKDGSKLLYPDEAVQIDNKYNCVEILDKYGIISDIIKMSEIQEIEDVEGELDKKTSYRHSLNKFSFSPNNRKRSSRIGKEHRL